MLKTVRHEKAWVDMTQAERRIFLIRELLREQPQYADIRLPADEDTQRRLLRSLMNVRMPHAASSTFLAVQDAYLQAEIAAKGITDCAALTPVAAGIYLWRGDITTLRCDAIVNAANSGLTGCYLPCHACIDNCIHTYAGIQLRLACAELVRRQGHDEEPGLAKLTPAFNLPCRYVLHTVGPIVSGSVTQADERLLASCYRSCLALAQQSHIKSVAFCCISTGEFHFPNRLAAQIAVQSVRTFLAQTQEHMEVIFNVFKDVDEAIYRELLGADGTAKSGA